ARALSEALRYTRKRQAFGGALAEQQGVQWMLADAATDLEAARGLVRAAVAAVDGGGGFSLAAAHAKKFATRVAFARIADCAQVMGAAGMLRDYPLARHLAAAKLA
ncbi:MAG: acyl-CoA dehydrogenase family protein, partial [Gammaproteobacteria bacterium]